MSMLPPPPERPPAGSVPPMPPVPAMPSIPMPPIGMPPPPGMAPGAAPSRRLMPVTVGPSRSLQVFLWLLAAEAAMTAGWTWAASTAYHRFDDLGSDGGLRTVIAEHQWLTARTRASAYLGGFWVMWAITFVLLLVWWRAVTIRAHVVSPAGRKWKPGWAVGGFFVPVANLLLPRLVLADAEAAALSRTDLPPVADPSAATEDDPRWYAGIGWAWWLLVVVGVSITLFASSADDSFSTASAADLHLLVPAAGLVLLSIGCGLGATHVRRLTARLAQPTV